jgi:hypothetical protein
MTDLHVKIVHPTDGRVVDVTVDETMTSSELLNELVEHQFIMASEQGYTVAIKGGNRLVFDEGLREAGVIDGAVLRVIPATDAGGGLLDHMPLEVAMFPAIGNRSGDDDPLRRLGEDFEREIATLRARETAVKLREIFSSSPKEIAAAANATATDGDA